MILVSIVLRGRVVSGMGDFGKWIATYREHYERKTGMRLYPGTLNVLLGTPFSFPPDAIRLEGAEYGGSVSVALAPCTIFGRRAFILRTDANESGRGDHPKTVIEIATDVRLRDEYGVVDGQEVEITI
jgi:riboflavin kinase